MLTDDIILMRYTEIDGELRRVLTVVKMRSSAHGRELCFYETTTNGLVVGEPLRGYRNILRGSPRRERAPFGSGTGLPEEFALLEALVQGGEASILTLVDRTGLPEESVSEALDLLGGLGVVMELNVRGTQVFRAAHRGS